MNELKILITASTSAAKKAVKEVRDEIFNEIHPIYTKDKDTTPTRYLSNGSVKNCFVADGCIIDGEIENSIKTRSEQRKNISRKTYGGFTF